MAALTYIRTFGSYHVGNTPATHVDRNAAGLLAVLVTTRRPVPRDRLFDLLWNRGAIASPSHSLSQALYALKRLIPGGLITDRRGLRLQDDVTVDYRELQDALANRNDMVALELYKGRFLRDFRYISDEFDDWKHNVAARIHDEVVTARLRAIREFEATEQHDRVAHLALAGLQLDPLDETLARARVLSLMALGDRVQAELELRRYHNEHRLEEGRIPESLQQLAGLIAHPPRTVTQSPPPATQLVGRIRELAALNETWQDLRNEAGTVFVTGEAGIGKTRLVQHILRRIAVSGGRIFAHESSEGISALPYGTIIGLLRDGSRRNDLQQVDPVAGAVLSSLIPSVLTQPVELPVDMPPGIVSEAVACYLEAIAARCRLVVCVENIQWVDESSRAVLAYLSSRLAQSPILFIYTSRNKACDPPVFEDRFQQTLHLELGEISEDDVTTLISSFSERFGDPTIRQLSNLLYRKVGGRPFFIIEALRTLKDTPASQRAEWYSQFVRSPVLTRHFADRLAQMPQTALILAKVAALINRPITLGPLAAIIDAPVTEATHAAALLVANGVFKEGREIDFAHDLIREAVALQVPAYEAAFWHARIATELTSDAQSLHEVAAHFERAGHMTEAYLYAQRAAVAAGASRAYRSEEDQYQRMLRCASNEQHREALYNIAKFWARTGQFLKLEPFLTQIYEALRTCPDAEIEVACAVAQMELDEHTNKVSSSDLARAAKSVIEKATRAGPSVLAQAVWHVAEHCRRSKEFMLMEQIAETLAVHAGQLGGKSAVEATAAAALLIASCKGYAHATAPADVAVLMAEQMADNVLISRTKFTRGTVRLWSGHLHTARQDYESAIQAADSVGATQVILAARANLAVVLAEQGDFETAVAFAQQCLLAGGARQRAFAYGNLALIHLRKPDYSEVRRYANALLECNRLSPEPWIPAHAAGFMGLVDIACGNIGDATRHAHFVAAHLHVADSVGDVSHLHTLRARAAVATGHLDEALAGLRLAAAAAFGRDYIAAQRLQLELAALSRHTGSANQSVPIADIVDAARSRGAYLLASEGEAILRE